MRMHAQTLAFAAVVIFFAPVVFAQESSCALDPARFSWLKDGGTTGVEIGNKPSIQEELRLRKTLLHGIINCAVEEILRLKSDFETTSNSGRDAENFRIQFDNWFLNMLNYYNAQKANINHLGLQGSKDFARDLREWRAGNSNKMSRLASNFIIWSKNQPLIQTAQNRLNQLRGAVNFFDLGLNEKIRSGLNNSESEFQKALVLNRNAGDSIRTYGAPEESLQAIRLSLESLAAAYQNMSNLAQKINDEIAK